MNIYQIDTYDITKIYDNIDNIIATIHIGIIVFCLYPTPKLRKEPSLLYINDGLIICIIVNININNNIDIFNLFL